MKSHHAPSPFTIKDGIHGLGVFIDVDLPKDSVVFQLEGEIIDYPTRTSVQVGEHKHIENTLAGQINHSCTPSVKVDRKIMAFVALKDLHRGEEITFNYNDNEDTLASPFICKCCNRKIRGKKFVTTHV